MELCYQEGAEFILKHFGEFGPQLESFSRKAFEDSWIEAEDRPNKRPGGFCTGMPMSEQYRIFMTYSGSMSNVATLAHELGHAFHSYALRPVHWMNQRYAMGVAETASTFAEMIVADALVELQARGVLDVRRADDRRLQHLRRALPARAGADVQSARDVRGQRAGGRVGGRIWRRRARGTAAGPTKRYNALGILETVPPDDGAEAAGGEPEGAV